MNLTCESIHQILLVIVASVYFVWKFFKWDQDTRAAMVKFLEDDGLGKEKRGIPCPRDHHELFIQDSLKSLPFAVQQHLVKVLFLILDEDTGKDYLMHQPVSIIKSLYMEQEGEYSDDSRWIPFKSRQLISTSPAAPGFVSDCNSQVFSKIPYFTVNRRDAYIKGNGSMDIKIMKVFPFIRLRKSIDTNTMQLTQWLMNTVMFPTSYFSHDGAKIQWEDIPEKCQAQRRKQEHLVSVYGTIVDPRTDVTAKVEFRFNCKGLITSVCGVLPRAVGRNKTVMTPWEYHMNAYRDHDGMVVPTKVKFGWVINNELQIVLKASITKMFFSYFK